MPKIGTSRRVLIDVAGETVTFICRHPSAQELSRFLNARFIHKRGKTETNLSGSRSIFMDQITTDLEGGTFEAADGTEQPIDASYQLTEADKTKWTGILGVKVSSFLDLIPMSWKSSAAQQFEDSANVPDEGPEKN